MHNLDHEKKMLHAHSVHFSSPEPLADQHHSQAMKATLKWYSDYESSLVPCESPCQAQPLKAGPPLCFSSGWSDAAKLSTRASKGCKEVLYTVLLSSRANEIHPVPPLWPNACAFAFVTSSSALYNASLTARTTPLTNWTLIPVAHASPPWTDLRRASRLPKLTPDLFFSPDAEYAVYADAKLLLAPHFSAKYIFSLLAPPQAGPGQVQEFPVLMMVQHPASKHLVDDLELIATKAKRGVRKTRYPQLVLEQGHHYLAMEARAGGNGTARMCLRFTFDAAMVIHYIGNRTWSSEAAAGEHIVSKGPAAQLRCAWLREFMSWADRDQPAGEVVLGTRLQQTLNRLPVEARARYNHCPGERVIVDFDSKKQVKEMVFLIMID